MTHTHESPRDVLLKTARDGAAISRRWGDEERASQWDALAVELGAALHVGCGGQWVSMRVLCDGDDPQVCARCGERRMVPAALVEDPEVAALHGPVVFGDFDLYRTPQTGDGAPSVPPAAVSPVAGGPPQEAQASGGESVPSPPQGIRSVSVVVDEGHHWLGPDRDCFCLIGGDHVAEPRFEKES